MEILIIGGLVVALMVYLSTKIKNEAKRAYEKEVFETKEFKLTKPDDFIIPIKEVSEFALEAFSKELSENEETEDYYQCRATVKIEDGIVDLNESEIEEAEPLKIFRKILINQDLKKSFRLEIFVLQEYEEKYLNGINLMLNSFSIK